MQKQRTAIGQSLFGIIVVMERRLRIQHPSRRLVSSARPQIEATRE